MRHGSLFSGIGGFDLAAQWMGWENVFQVEKDSFCQKVLAKNFLNTARYGDIKEFDGTKYRGAVDIISGGFPCQPFSSAGKRKGTEDDRHLWPEMFRIIREVQPRWIVGENVSGLLNWSGGMVLKQIKIDLESAGYQIFPPCILPACGVDAPHRRDRLWVIAYSAGCHDRRTEREIYQEDGRQVGKLLPSPVSSSQGLRKEGIATYAGCDIVQRWPVRYEAAKRSQSHDEQSSGRDQFHGQDWQDFPTESPVCRADDGIPNRVDRIKALGNAIVPQVAFEIFKAIDHVNKII